MIVAVPDWRGRVSPVFDVAEHLLLVDLEGQANERRRMESLWHTKLHERVEQLTKLRVDVLVCGAISWPLEALLTASGIRVIPLVCGEVADVVQAFREGTLSDERFVMPGCCRTRRQARNRHRRNGEDPTSNNTP